MTTAGLSTAQRFENCYSGAVYDVLREMGRPDQVLPSSIVPMDVQHVIAGPAFPISGNLVPGADPDACVLSWTEFLSQAPSGCIAICQPNDFTVSHMGELSAETLNYRGVRGYIVDGGCRDSAFIERLGFPVFCRYFTPRDIVGSWMIESINQPIEMGGVGVEPGDYILADRDGVVVIPEALIDDVLTRTEEVLRTENKVRTAILAGGDPKQAYLKYGKF